ncbi:MAG: hypothetical protein WA865_19305 [Spirulinaceae cyanobacterium]
MNYLIFYTIGISSILTGVRTNDEIHRLALVSAGLIGLSWGYFSSPVLLQGLGTVLLLGLYKLYFAHKG